MFYVIKILNFDTFQNFVCESMQWGYKPTYSFRQLYKFSQRNSISKANFQADLGIHFDSGWADLAGGAAYLARI